MTGYVSRIAIAGMGAAVLLATVPAQARDCVVGWIAHVDRLNDTITLDTGDVLSVSRDINLQDMSAGVRVKFVVKDSAYGRKAVSVAPAAAPARTTKPAGRV